MLLPVAMICTSCATAIRAGSPEYEAIQNVIISHHVNDTTKVDNLQVKERKGCATATYCIINSVPIPLRSELERNQEEWRVIATRTNDGILTKMILRQWKDRPWVGYQQLETQPKHSR